MKAFITGATGYIGWNVANTFRKAGYQVWGLTRSREKTSMLEKNEITPVIGSMQEPERFKDVALDCDVIIHTAIDYRAETAALDNQTIELFIENAKNSTITQTLLYTSGTWVYGDTSGQSVDENSLLAAIEEIAWWPEIEQIVLNTDSLNGLVIRPGVVYGKSGGMTGMWFKGATNGYVVQIVGDGNNHWAMVHVDDLAHAYLLAARSKLSGEAFNVVDHTRNTVLEMASAAAQAAGSIHQIEFIPLEDAKKEMGAAYAEALALDQIVEASKARELLGWHAAHRGFIPEVGTYYRAWTANQT
jgi:nucleoside-diphosphate-sugar epimerase